MKKIILTFLILITVCTSLTYIFREDITADIKDWLHIKPKQYIGATVDMSQILPESNHYVVNSNGEDLIDLGASLGMNTFRITNITSPTSQKNTPFYTQQQWQEVLGKMRRKGMYAVILIESNSTDTDYFASNLNDSYVDFVRQYIEKGDLCSFSNILAIDIRNEPILTQNNLVKLNEASQAVKSICPSMKVTIGSWGIASGNKLPSGEPEYYWHDPRAVPLLNNIVDLYSVHIYGFDKPLNGPYPNPYQLATNYLTAIRKYTDKPIFIEEFGSGNGSALTDQNTLGSQELQKDAYEGVLKAMYDFKNKGVVGATAYLFAPRSNNPDAWSISNNSGNILLPAAYTFKEYSN